MESTSAPEEPEILRMPEAATKTFSLIAQELPKESKFDVIRSFVKKFGLPALDLIKDEVFLAGSTIIDTEKIRSENPVLYSRFIALSFAIMLYKEDGFKAALNLIKAGETLRTKEAPEKLPALYFIASTAAVAMLNNSLIEKKQALLLLRGMINNESTLALEKAVFIELSVQIEPESICEYAQSSVPTIKTVAEACLDDLKGKVSCAH